MMTRLGFHVDWVTLVMRCVCSVTYTVGVNEGVGNLFLLLRGLRQGDPLSSSLLNDAKRIGIVRGALIGRGRLAINHLFFTDDCVLFGDAIEVRAQNVHYIIKEYKAASGQ
ncbi:hypothetical protein J1N35_002087 [Gossypium stocksii]|uniref:Reverse transcriptase domain-containing protein n=1 Tax=Gossypium stocksii TaxID=47602 RepID=A0A9D3WLA9_9ROSI|nr:hypothetical protein J1N35_002087 [Gossypium stocksii]